METRAYAKINWTLFVTGHRKDGYHSLDTVMQRIDLYNDIAIKPSAEWTVSSADGSLPTDGTNLTLKAAMAYMNAIHCSDKYAITIERNIPAGSGLGGGSADAAAVLRYLNGRYGRLTPAELSAMGLTLGADIPYCLTEAPARCTGIGEILNPLGEPMEYHLVLAAPSCSLSTVEVFQTYDRIEAEKLTNTKNILPSLSNLSNNMSDFSTAYGSGDPLLLAKAMKRFSVTNQLTDAASALAPGLDQVLADLKKAGALFASMSGSGACCFGLFEDRAAAEQAYEKIDAGFKAVVRTI